MRATPLQVAKAVSDCLSVMTPQTRSVLVFLTPRTTVVVTRRLRVKKGDQREEFVLTVGSPNAYAKGQLKRLYKRGGAIDLYTTLRFYTKKK